MTHEDLGKKTHKFLLEFLRQTENDGSLITRSIKATLAQFLLQFKVGINAIAAANQDQYSNDQLIECQIASLRACVVELHGLLTQKDTLQ